MSPLVVKIGGSLWRSPLLARWIAALRAFPGPLTIVPGGGPFADAVRAAQPTMGFSDRAAHKMAVLAMEQYGLALVDKFAGLESAATPRRGGRRPRQRKHRRLAPERDGERFARRRELGCDLRQPLRHLCA